MSDNMQSPAQVLAEEINSLQSQVNSLQNDVRLTHLQDEIGTLDNSVERLPQQVLDLRNRGYVFEKDLEAKTEDFKQRWSNQRPLVLQQITQQTNLLNMDMRQLEMTLSQIVARSGNPYAAQSLVSQAKVEVSSLQNKVTAAQNTIQAMYHAFNDDVATMTTHLNDINWTLAQLAQASFQLLPAEGALMAVKATWIKGSKESKENAREFFS